MKLRVILSKANDILKYLRTWRKRRLYKQWVKMAGLPPEAIPHEEVTGGIIPEMGERQLRLTILHMLLGASAVILGIGLILLIVHSC